MLLYVVLGAMLLGGARFLTGWIWLMVIAFGTDHWGHGVGILLMCGVYGFVYGIINWDICRTPVLLHGSGYFILLCFSAFG